MIYTEKEIRQKLNEMISSSETEVIEFKEAKTNYSFNEMGKYFSALSNEANIRDLKEAG